MKRATWVLLLAAVGCSSAFDRGDLGALDLAAPIRNITATDRDGDGISDADEATLATTYLPYLSLSGADTCSTNGLVVRVTPDAIAPRVRIRYAWLFDRSCTPVLIEGSAGSFSVLVDPTKSAATLSVRAVARAGTSCQHLSTCGQCLGERACETLGDPPRPAVWASRDRHALYVNRAQSCVQTGACVEVCSDAPTAVTPTIVNVGEPDALLVHDLTDEGFIRPDAGWQSSSLLHYDPWGGAPFGGAESVALMLTSTLGDTPSCAP